MIGCTSIVDLIADLDRESGSVTRFPVRFILLSGVSQWGELVAALRAWTERTLNLSDMCDGDDTLPYLGRLVSALRSAEAESILVLPLAEVLRLQPGDPNILSQLAEMGRPGTRRVYVPLLEVEDLFQGTVCALGRYLAGDLHPGWRLSGDGEARVDIAPLAPGWRRALSIEGLQSYLRSWELGNVSDRFVVSRQAEYLASRAGRVQVITHSSAADLAREEIRGLEEISVSQGTNTQWTWLLEQCAAGDDLPTLAARHFGVAGYDGGLVFSRWSALSQNQRWLLWLWTRSSAPRVSFYSLAAADCEHSEKLPETAALLVFSRSLSPDHAVERGEMLRSMGTGEMPGAFWQSFRSLSDPLAKLRVLTSHSARERCEAVLAVSELLRSGVETREWLPILEMCYPELALYLTEYPYADEEVRDYFRLYVRSRILDEADPLLLQKAAEFAAHGRLRTFPSRGAKLEALGQNRVPALWFDALGLEWAGLLAGLLRRQGLDVQLDVCLANLPTTTEFNREWETASPPRALDQLAHSYEYSHPGSLVRQIEVVAAFAASVAAAVANSQSTLVTSDHGLTRFARHGQRIDAPGDWAVHPRGRFATVPAAARTSASPDGEWILHDDKAILTKHSLFAGCAASCGEVHGGATPEEWLVPVIIARPGAAAPSLVVEVVTEVVQISPRGEGRLLVAAGAEMDELHLVLADSHIVGHSEGSGRWSFRLSGLRSGQHIARLTSHGREVGRVSWRVTRGMEQQDLGL